MNKSKKLLFAVLLILFIVVVVYLNRTYANIYHSIGNNPLPAQNIERTYDIVGESTSSQPLTCVAMGDSLTAGVGAQSLAQSWPYLVSTAMAKEYSQVKLINLGTPSAKSSDVIIRQLPLAVSAKPDYVTLLVGINDMHSMISLSDFSNNVISIVAQLRSQTEAKIVLINNPYIGGNKLFLPPYQWYFNWQTQRYNKVLNQICMQEKIDCIDLYSANSKFQKQPGFYSADNFHPSAVGYSLWSKVIYVN